MRRVLASVLAVSAASCVPNGPPTASDAGATTSPLRMPSTSSATARAIRAPTGAVSAEPVRSQALGARFQDDFERAELGDAWRSTSPVWKIDGGRLCGKGARNRPVWLARSLPTNVRIEFDATSDSPDGDIKAEFFGDGASAASTVSYRDATSYLTIFGGWKNSFHVLARIDEHAPGRPEIRVVPDGANARERPVVPRQVYHFRVERNDGRTVAWWVGDALMFKFADPEPLSGPGHDHFGFNDWDVPVCFDNVKVVPL